MRRFQVPGFRFKVHSKFTIQLSQFRNKYFGIVLNQKPVTLNLEAVISNLKPETWNLKPGTWNKNQPKVI